MKSIKDKLKEQKERQRPCENDKKTIEELSKKSESELMSELLSVASKQRNEGSLDNKTLDEFESKIAPSLTKEQQERLTQIIGMLKK